MKTGLLTVLTVGLISSQAIAGSIPDGSYTGKGLWKSQSETGSYELTTTVSGSNISSQYKLPGGKQENWNFEMVSGKNGFFTVKAFGGDIGRGYCLEQVQVCHYEVKVGEFELEETLTFVDGQFYRFGSKTENGERIMWQEALKK